MIQELIAIRDQIMHQFGIPQEVLLPTANQRGVRAVTKAREQLCYLLRHSPGQPSFPDIAKVVGCLSHGTVYYAVQRYAKRTGKTFEETIQPRGGRRRKEYVRPERPMYDDGDY